MIPFIALFLTFVSSLLGAYFSYRIANGTLSVYYVLITGMIHTGLWMMLLLYSKQNLIVLTAWFDVLIALGYFTMLVILGTTLSSYQLVGIVFLLIGLFLVNK